MSKTIQFPTKKEKNEGHIHLSRDKVLLFLLLKTKFIFHIFTLKIYPITDNKSINIHELHSDFKSSNFIFWVYEGIYVRNITFLQII